MTTKSETDWMEISDTPETDALYKDDHRPNLERQRNDARAYADKLAAGLPDGMMPKDVENLRDANEELAQRVHDLESAIRNLRDADGWAVRQHAYGKLMGLLQ